MFSGQNEDQDRSRARGGEGVSLLTPEPEAKASEARADDSGALTVEEERILRQFAQENNARRAREAAAAAAAGAAVGAQSLNSVRVTAAHQRTTTHSVNASALATSPSVRESAVTQSAVQAQAVRPSHKTKSISAGTLARIVCSAGIVTGVILTYLLIYFLTKKDAAHTSTGLKVVVPNPNKDAYNGIALYPLAGLAIEGADSAAPLDAYASLSKPVSALTGREFNFGHSLRENKLLGWRSLPNPTPLLMNPDIIFGGMNCNAGCTLPILKSTVAQVVQFLTQARFLGMTADKVNINGTILVSTLGANNQTAIALFNIALLPFSATASATGSPFIVSASATPSEGASSSPTPTETLTPTSSTSITPTSTVTATSTKSATESATKSATASATESATPTPSSTSTQTMTTTPTPSPSAMGLTGFFPMVAPARPRCIGLTDINTNDPFTGWFGTLGGHLASMNVSISSNGGVSVLLVGPPGAFWCDDFNFCSLPFTSDDNIMKYNYGNLSACTQTMLGDNPIIINGVNSNPDGVFINVTSVMQASSEQDAQGKAVTINDAAMPLSTTHALNPRPEFTPKPELAKNNALNSYAYALLFANDETQGRASNSLRGPNPLTV